MTDADRLDVYAAYRSARDGVDYEVSADRLGPPDWLDGDDANAYSVSIRRKDWKFSNVAARGPSRERAAGVLLEYYLSEDGLSWPEVELRAAVMGVRVTR